MKAPPGMQETAGQATGHSRRRHLWCRWPTVGNCCDLVLGRGSSLHDWWQDRLAVAV